jgi:hypothetical protein
MRLLVPSLFPFIPWFPAFELDVFLDSIGPILWSDPGQKKREEETRRESQLPVSSNKVSVLSDTPQAYLPIDPHSFPGYPDLAASLAGPNLSWLVQG